MITTDYGGPSAVCQKSFKSDLIYWFVGTLLSPGFISSVAKTLNPVDVMVKLSTVLSPYLTRKVVGFQARNSFDIYWLRESRLVNIH